MKRYYDSGKPTKYGQCWVQSGLFTAFCRCLGLPARSITTYRYIIKNKDFLWFETLFFSSAYDMDFTLTIDGYEDESGGRVDGSDFVWNYHVWCEMWLNRPDLFTVRRKKVSLKFPKSALSDFYRNF